MNNLLFRCGASRDIEGKPMLISEARKVFALDCGGSCANCPALVIKVSERIMR